MPNAAARIPTERADRYLGQLCRHLGQMSRMRHRTPTGPGGQPPAITHVDRSDTTGTIRFAQGTCTLEAAADALTVRVEAEDEDTLRRLQDGIARRLETIGRRDHLTVRWQRSDSVPEDAAPPPRRPRRLGRTLALAAVAAVAIVVHLGLLGGTLAASAWAGWGADIVLAIILLKVVTVGAHLLLGRAAFRHGLKIPRLGRRRVKADDPTHRH